ncbi:MAG: glycosyltransferase family 39 protein [Elusimicrobiota bacterium]
MINIKLISVLAFLVRFSFIMIAPERPITLDDASSWDNVAYNIISGMGFIESNGQPTYFRLPVYPLFLGSIYYIFGHNYFIAKAANSIVDSITVVILMLIAFKAFNDSTISVITGILLAIYPPLLVYNGIIGTEILYTFLLSLSIYLLMYKRYMISGIVMGVATQCRSTTILFPFFFLILYFLLNKEKTFKVNLKKALAFVIPFIIILLPWSIRNYRVFDVFTPVNVGAGHLFWSGTSIELKGMHAIGGKNDLGNVYPELQKYSMMKRDQIAFEKGFENIYRHPFGFIKLTAKKFIWFLFQPVGQVLAEKFSPAAGKLLYFPHTLLVLLAGAGIYFSRGAFRALLPVTSILLYFTIMHSIISTIPRYRLPIEPYILLFAVYSVFYIHNKYFRKGVMLT